MPFLRKYTGLLKTAARKRLSAIAIAVDAYFNYVTLLLSGDGTNAAQNSTFLDSSTNNFTITRAGNTTQGSFSPYGSNWSNNFDGTLDYLQTPSNAVFGFASDDFTIEFWINSSKTTGMFFVDIRGGSAVANPHITTGGASENKLRWGGTSLVGTTTIIDGRWHHCAVTRQSGTIKLWVDGVQDASGSDTGSFGAYAVFIGVNSYGSGAEFGGHMSNLRIVKGTAVYTTTFTPSTTPLTAISGTSLLTCQSNRFKDNSTNNFEITATGTVNVQRFNPFGASAAYSTSVIGGSGYFDGTTDYLSGPTNNAAFQFGTGDFTVEAWVYHTVDDGYPSILEIGNHLTTAGILFIKFGPGGGNVAAIYSGGFKGSTPVTMNSWNHIAYVRSSGSLKIYVNGVSPAGVAFTNNLTDSNKVTIGTDQNLTVGYYFSGNISNLRVVKGTAVYTANFTPPTEPLTAVSGTSLLLNTINAGIIDNAMIYNLETVGNSQISTSVVKYGTGSMAFDGTGDYVKSPDNLGIAFGTNDFTVEGWIYLNNVNESQTKALIFGKGNNSFGFRVGQSFQGNVNGLCIARSNILDLEYCAFTFAINTWYHVAVVRSGTTLYFFVDGVQQTTVGSGGNTYNFAAPTSGFNFGANNDGGESFNGNIDDFRITKGYARYTSNFTPPNQALPKFQTF